MLKPEHWLTPRPLPAFCWRAEAVASSRIEGLEVGARRLLHAEAGPGVQRSHLRTSRQPRCSATSTRWCTASRPSPLVSRSGWTCCWKSTGGCWRVPGSRGTAEGCGREQNWIGGSSYNPCSAAFVPAPPEFVAELMADLCAFCSTDDLPCRRPSGYRARAVRDHPPVRGRQRPNRAGHSSTSSFAGEGSRFASCRRSRSSLRPGRTATSTGSLGTGLSGRPPHPKPLRD